MAASIEILWQLGSGSLQDWDEAIYAEIAWEIIQRGDWLTLHWGYEPWFEKPPLLMWCTALLYQLFSVDEFWSRAASAFSGIALTFITYATGKWLYDRHVGLLSAAVLLSSYDFLFYARFGTADVMLTTFTLIRREAVALATFSEQVDATVTRSRAVVEDYPIQAQQIRVRQGNRQKGDGAKLINENTAR